MYKKILIPIVTIFILAIASLAIIPVFFFFLIDSKIKSTINISVNAHVNFQDFDLSLLSTFPNMGIKINDLIVVGTDSFAHDTLANVKVLQLNLDLLSVIKGEKYQINSIELDHPIIFAKVLKSGKANWDIMKKDSLATNADTSKTSFKVALQKYSIEDGTITYDDSSLGF